VITLPRRCILRPYAIQLWTQVLLCIFLEVHSADIQQIICTPPLLLAALQMSLLFGHTCQTRWAVRIRAALSCYRKLASPSRWRWRDGRNSQTAAWQLKEIQQEADTHADATGQRGGRPSDGHRPLPLPDPAAATPGAGLGPPDCRCSFYEGKRSEGGGALNPAATNCRVPFMIWDR